MATLPAQWCVLSGGYDELNLWELPGRVGARGAVGADLGLAEVREVLVAALREDLVRLYDQDDPAYPELSLDEALAVVAEDSEWNALSARARAALTITPEGVRASHAVWRRYRELSPFLALGLADPNVPTPEAPKDDEA